MTAELGVWALGFVALVCLLSGFAHGAIGFGFPMVATPLVALVIDIKLAIGLLAPITLVLVLITALRGGGLTGMARRFWYLPLLVAAGAWLGTKLLLAAPPEPFVLVLALVILLYLNLDRVGRGSSPAVQRMPVLFGVAFGFTAGVFEAVANVAGPVLLVYFMLLGLAPVALVQALNLCFSFGKSTQVAAWALSGAIAPADWAAIGAFCVPSVAALFAGMRLRSRIDAETYRRWLRKALGVMALLLIGQFAVSTHAFAANDELFAAIEQGKELAAEGLLARGRAQLEARDGEGETPLHRAIEKGMKGLVQALLQSGASLRARSGHGETALHYAALHVDPALADVLLRAGAEPRVRNDEGESPLFWAALAGNVETARRLIEAGADANVPDIRGSLPLHGAAEGGYADMVELLVPLTLAPAAPNREGKRAEDYARSRGHDDIAELLKRLRE
ncbi:MAG TPA: TSUP family transporter [Burkholderiales bacterium]|jgi:hypothetical protein|nr:TSUP family transporter [Burkholderiales bacterium]